MCADHCLYWAATASLLWTMYHHQVFGQFQVLNTDWLDKCLLRRCIFTDNLQKSWHWELSGYLLLFYCFFFFFKSIVSVFLSGKEIDNHSEFKIIKSSDNELMLKNCHAERAVRSQVRVHYVIGQPSLLLCRGNSWRNPAQRSSFNFRGTIILALTRTLHKQPLSPPLTVLHSCEGTHQVSHGLLFCRLFKSSFFIDMGLT